VPTGILFLARQNERVVPLILAQLLTRQKVAGGWIVKVLAGRARDIGASQVGGTASMRIGRSGIGQVLDDAEVLLVTLQWRKSLGQLIQCARFGWIKCLLGETVAHPAKDHPLGRLGQGKQGTSGSQEVSSVDGGWRFHLGHKGILVFAFYPAESKERSMHDQSFGLYPCHTHSMAWGRNW
jgi:hypothetical protein